MAYVDNSINARRHIGRMRYAHSFLGNYVGVAKCVVTGTAVTTPTEAEIIAGGDTLILTLTGNVWQDAGAAKFDLCRQDIIDYLIRSPQAEATGLALVLTTAVASNVVRTSATIVTVTLPTTDLYKLTANETWLFQVPPTALLHRGGKMLAEAAATHAVVNSTGSTITAALTGTALAGGVVESAIVTGSETIICTLTNGTWVASGASFNAKRAAILAGLVAAEAEAAGWNAQVSAALVVANCVRTSDTIVTVTLPAVAGYVITSNEVITMTIPKAAINVKDADLVATETITITANS